MFKVFLFLLLLLPLTARSEVLTLDIKDKIRVTVDGVIVREGIITGEKSTILLFFKRYAHAESCELLLTEPSRELTVVMDYFTVARPSAAFPPRTIIFALKQPADLLKIVKATQGSPPTTLSPNDPPPSVKPPPSKDTGTAQPNGTSHNGDRCEVEHEICIDSEGNASTSIGCGPITVTFSAKGEFSIKASSKTPVGKLSATISLGGT